MVFSRSGETYSKYLLCIFIRFAYVRYASGLVKEGVKLLHQLAIIFFVIFCIKRNVTLYYAYLYKSIYKGAPKMLFCMKQNITAAFKHDNIGKSVKPKILLIVTSILIIFALTYFYISAVKSRYLYTDNYLDINRFIAFLGNTFQYRKYQRIS